MRRSFRLAWPGAPPQNSRALTIGAPARALAVASPWGWLPALSLLVSISLMLIAVADGAARRGMESADLLFWTGLVLMYAPALWRLFTDIPQRRERVGLLILLSIGLYIVKVLHSPNGYTFFDELLHVRTANDILRSGRLFAPNPMLPVSPLYPGLELVTTALVQLTGLSVTQAGIIFVGVARLLQTLALFRLFDVLTGSQRLAGIATALYLCHPHYSFFNAQFAYESVALPLAVVVLLLLARRSQIDAPLRWRYGLLAGLLIVVVSVTHHATAYVLLLLMLLWTATALLSGRLGAPQRHPGWFLLLALGVNIFWLATVSTVTIEYLEPHLLKTMNGILNLIAGEERHRQLFRSERGEVAPLLERLSGIGSAVLVTFGLPLGLWRSWRFRRSEALIVVLAIMALGYPASLGMRITGAGWEVAARAAASLFIGVGCILAFTVEALGRLRRGRLWMALCVPATLVIFAGGVVAGWSPSSRLPRPYVVADLPRSIEPQGKRAAEWMLAYLGPGNRVATDRTNTVLMGSYGEQRTVTDLQDRVTISPIFLAKQLGSYERSLIARGQIRYLEVDRRISTAMPNDGHYYESWERITHPYDAPIPISTLEKFDTIPQVDRIFDSGDLRIYDVGAFIREP